MLAFSSAPLSMLGARVLLGNAEVDNDVEAEVEVDRLLVVLKWDPAEATEPCDDAVLSRTTRLRTGLASLLVWLRAGEDCRVDGCALVARVRRLSSPMEATEALRMLLRLTGFCCSGCSGCSGCRGGYEGR
ncbi:hypothetical protein RRF57_008781 [Xylaria bambusicola]|uniref:Uncharacterized protein n=1 Tax=Xylaria bambusicola TaxID=326684 RepID=A0AAN7Z8K4_9PEZI